MLNSELYICIYAFNQLLNYPEVSGWKPFRQLEDFSSLLNQSPAGLNQFWIQSSVAALLQLRLRFHLNFLIVSRY